MAGRQALVVIPYQVRSYQTYTLESMFASCMVGRNPLSSQVISNEFPKKGLYGCSYGNVVIPYQVRSYQTEHGVQDSEGREGVGRNPLSSQVISNLLGHETHEDKPA